MQQPLQDSYAVRKAKETMEKRRLFRIRRLKELLEKETAASGLKLIEVEADDPLLEIDPTPESDLKFPISKEDWDVNLAWEACIVRHGPWITYNI
jgi:hypothetical protein